MAKLPFDASAPSSPAADHHLKLACQECRRRKVRCDRAFPCRRCQVAGVQCTQTRRKKRDPGNADTNVRNRIAKLESLVARLRDEPNHSTYDAEEDTSPRYQASTNSDARTPTTTATTHIAAPFWSTLSEEIQALKEEFGDDDSDSDDEPSPPDPNGLDLFLSPPGTFHVRSGVVNELSSELARSLCEVYIARIEPLFKRLHVPTLNKLVYEARPYLGREAQAPCNKFLIAAMCFHAVSIQTEDEVSSHYGQSRYALLQQTRLLADMALVQADPMNTEDLATVQALLIYINSLRTVDSSRRGWMLTAVAVRLCKALYLHQEQPTQGDTLFIIETKRRLWHSVCVADSYFALDRGSEPIIRPLEAQLFATPLPRNINDDEFDESTSRDKVFDEDRFTEMTYTLLASEAAFTIEKLCAEDPRQTCEDRMAIAQNLADSMERKYVRHCDPQQPLQRLAIGIARIIRYSFMLRAIRPFHRYQSAPPRVDNEWVLQLAVDSLRATIEILEDPLTARWRRLPWVPWHTIAVALASLCSIRGTPLADEAWVMVTKSIEIYKGVIADTKRGMLWKPIARLRAIAETFRNGQRDTAQGFTEALSLDSRPDFPVGTGLLNMDPKNQAVMSWPQESFDATMGTTDYLPDPSTWHAWEESSYGFQGILFDTDPSMMPFMLE